MYDRGTPRDLTMTNFYQQQLNLNHQSNNGWVAPNFPSGVQGMHGFAGMSTGAGHQGYGFVGAPQNFNGSAHGYVGQGIAVHQSFQSPANDYGFRSRMRSGQNAYSHQQPRNQGYQIPQQRSSFH